MEEENTITGLLIPISLLSIVMLLFMGISTSRCAHSPIVTKKRLCFELINVFMILTLGIGHLVIGSIVLHDIERMVPTDATCTDHNFLAAFSHVAELVH